jgi:hypothetical protein
MLKSFQQKIAIKKNKYLTELETLLNSDLLYSFKLVLCYDTDLKYLLKIHV